MTEVVLSKPIKVQGGDPIEKVTVREPTTGELRGVRLSEVLAMDVNALLKIMPRVVMPYLTPVQIASLPLRDFTKLSSAFVGFFVDTGETAEPQSLSQTT